MEDLKKRILNRIEELENNYKDYKKKDIGMMRYNQSTIDFYNYTYEHLIKELNDLLNTKETERTCICPDCSKTPRSPNGAFYCHKDKKMLFGDNFENKI